LKEQDFPHDFPDQRHCLKAGRRRCSDSLG
jgi:hypothetical protein